MYAESAPIYDAIYSFKDYAAEAAKIREIVATRLPGARSLLDVACGTGKHLEQLGLHFEVEGLDITAELLRIATDRLPGTPLHLGDMMSFDLGRRFDVGTCLFSAIGYATTLDGLDLAIGRMAAHLDAPGLMIVEPWLDPSEFIPGHLGGNFVDLPHLKVARVNTTAVSPDGRTTLIDFHYLVGTPGRIDYFQEPHELRMFTKEEYLEAFRRQGLEVEHDAEGLIGRGLYLASKDENQDHRGG